MTVLRGDPGDERLRVSDAPVRRDGRWVLYWMIAARRTRWSFALDHALAAASELGRPLVVLEALSCDHRWASERLHRFVLDGMADQAAAFQGSPVLYHPYVEPASGAGRGLLHALAADACLVVTDDWPCFGLDRMVVAAAERLPVRTDVVDGNGIVPMRETSRVFPTAYAFRRHLHGVLREHLLRRPCSEPLADVSLPRAPPLPAAIAERWPATDLADLGDASGLAALPIDHGVRAVPHTGGERAGAAVLARFLDTRLSRYAEERNQPEREVTSGLSPYLHFGHVSAQEVVHALLEREGRDVEQLPEQGAGKRAGWWGLSESAEAFLDQLVTWRELGFNMVAQRADADRYDSLPDWAQATLAEHAADPREYVYDLDTFAAGRTHDPLWNAAQLQLARDGHMHNYLRMLWGKKILEWSPSPEEALATMLALNDRYALDGRDPNSLSGIFWTLGRYDRAWGPERPIFGKIRFMSSANTARKVRVGGYVERWTAPPGEQGALFPPPS